MLGWLVIASLPGSEETTCFRNERDNLQLSSVALTASQTKEREKKRAKKKRKKKRLGGGGGRGEQFRQ